MLLVSTTFVIFFRPRTAAAVAGALIPGLARNKNAEQVHTKAGNLDWRIMTILFIVWKFQSSSRSQTQARLECGKTLWNKRSMAVSDDYDDDDSQHWLDCAIPVGSVTGRVFAGRYVGSFLYSIPFFCKSEHWHAKELGLERKFQAMMKYWSTDGFRSGLDASRVTVMGN